MTIPTQIKKIPKKPGVYLFKNKSGEILYIGKALSLKNRVRSYFQKSPDLSPAKQIMIGRIAKIEYIITSSEGEAILLESSLIQKHQPPYNVDLKDDKYFLYIKITLNEDYPRVFTTRRVLKDKARYFGPYISAISTRKTLWLLRKLFPHRNFPKLPSKHEQEYLMRRYPELLGPSDKIAYRQTIDRIVQFLEGRYEGLVKKLRTEMDSASRLQQYERAAKLRDHIQAIEKIMQEQKVVSVKRENEDVISLARGDEVAAINLFQIRDGKLIQRLNFLLKNTRGQTDQDILAAFIERYYVKAQGLPKTVILPHHLPEKPLMNKSVTLVVPVRGRKRKLMKLGDENAQSYLDQQRASWEKQETKIKRALEQFKQAFKLPSTPHRIEAFDISNIQGQHPVGSMVVFENGMPTKRWYRKFHIKTVQGANDPAMMAEVTRRRFGHLASVRRKTDEREKWPMPDLVMVDGGKGQLNAARNAIASLHLNVPIIALAKREEDVYLPEKKTPFRFPPNSEALFLLQRIRDEAHRFAVGFFRKKHMRESEHSVLDEIPGLGSKKKQSLLKAFGTLDNIRSASAEELDRIVGKKLAGIIKKYV